MPFQSTKAGDKAAKAKAYDGGSTGMMRASAGQILYTSCTVSLLPFMQALPPPPMPFQPKKERDKATEVKAKDGGKMGREPVPVEKPKARVSPGKAK